MSMTVIKSVDPRSPARRAGVRAGETLTHINGHQIVDVLDYKFYSYDPKLELTLKEADGTVRISLGLFNTMDEMDEAAAQMEKTAALLARYRRR